MNDLLQLKGTYTKSSHPGRFEPRNIPNGKSVTLEHLKNLLHELEDAYDYFSHRQQILGGGALLSIEYITIAAKSNRVSGFLSKGSKIESSSSIRGAKFSHDGLRHIITHYIKLDILDESVNNLKTTIKIVEDRYTDKTTSSDIEKLHAQKAIFDDISRSLFVDYIVDAYYVSKFFVNEEVDESNDNLIVTIYDTNTDTTTLMGKLGIKLSPGSIYDKTTILFKPAELSILKLNAPFLISMATTDISKLTKDDFDHSSEQEKLTIPKPSNESTIGVIDTMFDKTVYFSDWVDFHNMLPSDIFNLETNKDETAYTHGTAVTSIIVDGPSLNPKLDDGCGRFKVRHFGVTIGKQFSSFTIIKEIETIVASNRDITVWNLSLGSELEVHKNFISPEATILDELQHEYDIIFVIAGTNDKTSSKKRLGAPADSINALVVNSVNAKRKPASYTRVGPVLEFFNKPDVSYFGGDKDEKLKVCTSNNNIKLSDGTSLAAPWIARKMAYLVDVVGLSRETAKALLIDAATGWGKSGQPLHEIGYGIVPIKIRDIIKSQTDEIRFILSGTIDSYNTYNYNLPVPISNDKYPYIAKATLCYFPHCSRREGVDYTSTEFNIKFGRVGPKKLEAINNDLQDEVREYVTEKVARENYRKWDNVKHIGEFFTGNNRGKKVYDSKMWGIEIKSKERGKERYGRGVNFGIVITLKEINGENRIEEFIKNCGLRGWLVNRINVEERVNVFNMSEERIIFDE